MHTVTVAIETEDGCSVLEFRSIHVERRRIRQAQAAQGREALAALLSDDGMSADTGGADAPTPSASRTEGTTQIIPAAGPITVGEMLMAGATQVYRALRTSVTADFDEAIMAGVILRLARAPRPWPPEAPAFVYGNTWGIFLLIMAPTPQATAICDAPPASDDEEVLDVWHDGEITPWVAIAP